MKTVQLVKHIAGCIALKQERWPSPWSPISKEFRFAEARNPKRKRGSTCWIVYRCNSIRCPALIAVRGQDIITQLPRGESEKTQKEGGKRD